MKLKKTLLLSVVALATLLGFLSIAPSVVKTTDDGFNSFNALSHLQVISKEPHSVSDYQAHEDVRQYILATAKGFVSEENVEERNYLTVNNTNPTEGIDYIRTVPVDECDQTYDIRNVLVTIPGKSKIGMLLVAHYDSRGNRVRNGELAGSYGAADDGYGVVTLLEAIRYFSEKENLENSLYVLFTDAEEVGMDGSYQEAYNNEELMNKVNFVVNVEARGTEGACYMFETSKVNQKVIEMYRHASDRVTYSIAPAIYSVMTNFTDFTNFLAVGKQGLNFSTLDSIETYHVPADNFENVSQGSLQHYGEQIFPIIEEYIFDAKYQDMNYFVGANEMVFFNFLPGLFIEYSSIFALVTAILILGAVIGYYVIQILKKKISWKQFGCQFGIYIGLLVLAIVIGYIFSNIVARLQGYPWSLTNVRCESFKPLFLVFIIGVGALLIAITNKTMKTKSACNSSLLCGVTFLSVLNLAVSVALPGASFIFLIPSLFGILALYFNEFIASKLAKNILGYIALFVMVLVFVPLVYSLLLAVTIGGALVLALIAYLPFGIILPMLKEDNLVL